MILSDRGIRERLRNKSLVIEPLLDTQIQSASIDVNLGDTFMKVDEYSQSNMNLETETRYVTFRQERVVVPPQSFLLASTEQTISLPSDLIVFVEGRSSIGRMGLFIQNAGWVDPGYHGRITLELFNANRLPIELKAGQKICQFVVAQLDQPSEHPYKGKYQDSGSVVGSRIHEEYGTSNAR